MSTIYESTEAAIGTEKAVAVDPDGQIIGQAREVVRRALKDAEVAVKKAQESAKVAALHLERQERAAVLLRAAHEALHPETVPMPSQDRDW